MTRFRLPCRLLGHAALALAPEAIGVLYPRRFAWGEGRRLPAEAKLVHLACDEALAQAGLPRSRSTPFPRTAIVLASANGGLASYERFRDSLTCGDPQPLAFSFALPGIPASVLSLYYRILGPVMTFAQPTARCGATALRAAMDLLASDRCDAVLVGTWSFPTTTARACGSPDEPRAALGLLVPGDGAGALALEVSSETAADGQVDGWFEYLGNPLRADAGALLPLQDAGSVRITGTRP